MKKTVKIILIIASALFAQACSEDFIDLPYKNGTVDVNFYQTPEHAEQAVTGMYAMLTFPELFTWYGLAMGSDPADEVVEDHGDAAWERWIALDKYTWNTENGFIGGHWNMLYKGILRTNEIIKNVPAIKGLQESLSNRYVAEAKTLRALFYYNVVINWGDAPLYTEPVTLEDAKVATRNPASEIWAQIITDLNEAKGDLPDTYGSSEVGRVTSGFANGLLSRVYLWTKEYDKAAQAAQAVMKSSAGYDLEQNYSDLFDGTMENGIEILLDVQSVTGRPGDTQWRTGESTSYNKTFYWFSPQRWAYFFGPSREFIDNMFEDGDVRKSASVLDMAAGDVIDMNNDGVVDEVDDGWIPKTPTQAHVLKGVPKGVDLTNWGSYRAGVAQWVNVHIMRYAEVLLNMAEALNEQGQTSQALEYINEVRDRADLDDLTTTNQAELRDAILHERAIEFCFEGMRFHDLRRTGNAAEVLGPLGYNPSIHSLFPIPQREIDLTQMEQNPGY